MRRRIFMFVGLGSAVLALATLAGPAAIASSVRVCPSAGPGCPFTSIQAAVNAVHGPSTITIARGTYRENVVIGAASATPLTLVSEGGAGAVTIDGQAKGSVLTVTAGHTLKVVGLTLTNGSAFDGGGIANLGGTVTVIDGRIVNNRANFSPSVDGSGFGGGVFNTDVPPPTGGGGTLTLTSTLVRGNHADFSGGGVATISFAAATHATLTNTTIENNTSSNGSGGLENCGTLRLTASPIRNNTANQGGGLTNCGNPPSGPSGTALLINSPVSGNHATGGPPSAGPSAGGHGGGISNGGTLTLVSSPVTDNTSKGPGSGIFNAPTGTVSRTASPVTGNTPPPQCVGTIC
jgi:hypothetical protein